MSSSIKSRSRKRLFVALAIGLVAALATYAYTDTNVRQAQRPVETVSVVVAREDIPAKARLSLNLLTTREMPLEAKHPAALTSLVEAEGKITAFPITSGEQILNTKFKAEMEPKLSLSHLVPPGARAMAITFNETIGTGGLIVPGDRVDVIAVFDAKTMGKDEAAIILQDILVLAIAQAIEGDEEMPVQGKDGTTTLRTPAVPGTSAPASTPNKQGNQSTSVDGDEPEKATARPQAKSATLAVTPEQAQRLALAEATGKLRLVLRPARESGMVDLPEAVLSRIKEPLKVGAAVITSAEISPTNVKPGDVITVRITVKNTSNVPLKTQGPGPGFVYVQGQTFHSQDYPSMPGTFRVGVNFGGQSPVQFPYRWGFGGELAPGASTTIEGQIKVTYDFQATNYWVGLIQEPAEIVQDAVATTLVTSVPDNVAVVAVDVANVRGGPSVSSAVITQVMYGTALQILGQSGDWYRVRLDDGLDGWVAAGWIVAPSGR